MNQIANCPKCGAPQAISQRGRVYCTDKCWLKGDAKAPSAPAKTSDSVWEAKDRQSAAQTALKFAGDLFQGHPDKIDRAKELALWAYHQFLRPAFRGTIANVAVEPRGETQKDEDINVDDIPF